jgi:hypothetical protein
MLEQSISGWIWFGTVLRYLQDAEEGWRIHGETVITGNLKSFLANLDKLGLPVTSSAAGQQGLPKLLAELEDTSPDSRLTKPQAGKLGKLMDSLRLTLDAEAVGKKAFVTSPKRWDVDKLLTDPGSLFSAGALDQFGDHPAIDFREACKCLAFECSTAAAFHMMRGTEAGLRDYYCSVVKQKRLPPKKRMWGPMLQQMASRSKPPPKKILVQLDHIREHYRNPTQHPDEVYDIERAQDLLGLCIPVMNQMAAEISS